MQSSSRIITSAALIVGLALPLMAQVNYDGREPWGQRAESGPDAEVPGWFYNLGLTGQVIGRKNQSTIKARLQELCPKA